MRSSFRIKISLVVCLLVLASIARADLDDLKDLGISPSSPSPSPTPERTQARPDLGQTSPSPAPASSAAPSPQTAQPTNTPPQPSAEQAAQDEKDRKKPIQWSAKGLRGTKQGKVVDLMEDVVVTQGGIKMTSNSAKIHFDDDNKVTQVVATGNVKVSKRAIRPEDRITARGNQAIFYNDKRKVTLKGRAALWRGSDVVRGKQITYSLDTGWITVDQVEGVVKPGEKNLSE